MDCRSHLQYIVKRNSNALHPRFDAWIRSVDAYAGNDLLYLNPTGTLPDSTIIHKGIRRENRFKERRVFDTTSFDNRTETMRLEEEGDETDDDVATMNKHSLEETEG